MIDGVNVKRLKFNCDERGRLIELLRSDWQEYVKFGQAYLTTAYPGVVKAWHYHKLQTDTFVCVKGMMKVVLYDSRPESKTKGEVMEVFMGEHNPVLIQIPPDVYHGFKCISCDEAMIINIPTEVYNNKKPDEYRLPAHAKEIPYDWERKDG